MALIASIAGFGAALTTDLCLQLANEEYVRTLSVGSTWATMRLGAHIGFTGTPTSGSVGASLLLGLCSGKTHPFHDGATTNFIGVNLAGNAGTTGNVTANFGPPWYNTVSGHTLVKRVGNTNTTAGGTSSNNIIYNDSGQSRRSIMIVDITKGNPNYTITSYYWAGFTSPAATADFTAAMASGGAPPAGMGIVINAQTIACDEIAGGFDTFDLYSTPAIDVFAIATRRIL